MVILSEFAALSRQTKHKEFKGNTVSVRECKCLDICKVLSKVCWLSVGKCKHLGNEYKSIYK